MFSLFLLPLWMHWASVPSCMKTPWVAIADGSKGRASMVNVWWFHPSLGPIIFGIRACKILGFVLFFSPHLRLVFLFDSFSFAKIIKTKFNPICVKKVVGILVLQSSSFFPFGSLFSVYYSVHCWCLHKFHLLLLMISQRTSPHPILLPNPNRNNLLIEIVQEYFL